MIHHDPVAKWYSAWLGCVRSRVQSPGKGAKSLKNNLSPKNVTNVRNAKNVIER